MHSKKYNEKLFKPTNITDVINQYKKAKTGPSENIELEIRFKNITKEVFMGLIDGLESPKLECSINTIVHDTISGGNKIRRITFEGLVKKDDELSVKAPLMDPLRINDYISYSINLSSEKLTNVSLNSPDAMMRYKVRVSENMGDWRLDLTATRSMALTPDNSKKMGPLKDKLFGPFGKGSHSEAFEAISAEIEQYEVELEYIGAKDGISEASFDIVKALFGRIDPQYGQNVKMVSDIKYVAKLIGKDKFNVQTLKELLPQVVALNKVNYSKIFPPEGFYMSEKADGFRALVILREYEAGGFHLSILADKYYEINTEGNGAFKATIIDAEMIQNGPKYELLAFDIISLGGQLKTNEPFEVRLGLLEGACGHISKTTGALCIPKAFVLIELPIFQDQIKKVMKVKHEIDGLIFNAPGQKYTEQKMYKWKPLDKNTVDFLAIKVKDGLYYLFVGIEEDLRRKLGIEFVADYEDIVSQVIPKGQRSAKFIPIQFSPSANPKAYVWNAKPKEDINGKIVEMLYLDGHWSLVKARSDRKPGPKYYGNYYTIAEATYQNSIDPLTIEGLYNPQFGYFEISSEQGAKDIYEGQKRFKRMVIGKYIEQYANDTVVDLAAGRGADLPRYIKAGTRVLMALDIDPTALSDLVQRKIGLSDKIKNSMAIYTLAIDLKAPWEGILATIRALGADDVQFEKKKASFVVCNFAFHYFCDSDKNIRNLLGLVGALLDIGGHFMFTVMDGEMIFDLLRDSNEWLVREGEIIKYQIKKLYAGNTLADVGQMISVKLPFATTLYDEPLCNVGHVIEEAKILGFDPVTVESFGRYKASPLTGGIKVTDDDLKFIDIYKVVVLKKMRK
jgi:mRNA capping enzyme/mRNA capping enzyme, catalytic domain